jgi:hypothetical protein
VLSNEPESPDHDDIINHISNFHKPTISSSAFDLKSVNINPQNQDYKLLISFFAYAFVDTIKCTLKTTKQYFRSCICEYIKQHYCSHCPACYLRHRSEPVATATFICDTPSVVHVMSSCKSLYTSNFLVLIYTVLKLTKSLNILLKRLYTNEELLITILGTLQKTKRVHENRKFIIARDIAV